MKKDSNKATIIILVALLAIIISTTYAWFINNDTVDLSINANVKSWNIEFGPNDSDTENIVVEIADAIYPGKTVSTEDIKIVNRGDVNAELDYKIKSVTLFGETKTGDELLSLPFIITGQFNDNINSDITASGGEGKFKVILTWPFELEQNATEEEKKAKDDLDTLYSQKAYEYMMDAVNSETDIQSTISIQIELIAKQKETNN